MKEQFDKKLVDKIRDSFEHYEEPYDPAQWDKLSNAYFKPKKTSLRLIWPFITAGFAASLFLVLFYGPFGVEFTSPMEIVADSMEQSSVAEDSVQGTISAGDQADFESPTKAGVADALTKEEPPKRVVPTPQRALSSTSSPDRHVPTNERSAREFLASESVKRPTEQGTSVAIPDGVLPKPSINEPADSLVISPESNSKGMDLNEALQVLNQWMADGAEQQPSPVVPKSTAPIKLGVLVAPQASSDAVNGMNLGAGVMSEFSLSRKLRLDVGMTYARQTLSPDMAPSMAIAAEASYARADQMAMANNIRTSSNFIGSSSQLSLASLDIPVNLKYLLLERKNTGLFLITGLSSMVYLDQAATETFETNSFFTSTSAGLNFAPSVEQFTSVYRPEGSGRADIGGMLNLSVGYEYNLKNGMFISLEPFYKLPLGDLTFVNQQFSVAGMNLRMNFNLRK
ncbi:MAG: hypothetical protein JJU34_12345 [Lunatimonas sp.]|uniref:hypothetical protein n=1 Tax=Lunatimonas sp. TaxID=2060141 RepID=UPI00263AB5D6|nr:hypothetical protein [Lunatimonas sp.]MCC5938063.1 hypothetical protein [Lunatimonas sp.]